MNREPDCSWWDETCAIALRHARGASDAADDLAQDLAVAALERGARVERPGAWLERVGRNAVIDRWRVERRRGELAGEIAAPTSPPDPEERLLAGERRGVLRRALASLPRPLRRATLARFHADLPFDAVAARLGTEPVTARTRVHRALARLRLRVGGLRAVLVAWPGAQATVLGLTLVTGVARPALFPVAAAVALRSPTAVVTHGRRVAASPAPKGAPEPVAPSSVAAAPGPAVRPAPAQRAPNRATASMPSAVQRLSFGDDLVAGDLAGPDGVVVVSEPVIEHLSLIELRWHFLPEIIKTLEDL
jgi:RNA polymerase sigma factor (sigma-70 family)